MSYTGVRVERGQAEQQHVAGVPKILLTRGHIRAYQFNVEFVQKGVTPFGPGD